MIDVEDKVYYVPGEGHALDRDIDGNYPWVMAFPKNPQGDMEELYGKRVTEVLNWIKRHPDSANERKKLKFIRPAKTWPAVVTAVNLNGTVNLDITCHNGGVTLHYDNVPVATPANGPYTPHTCFKIYS